MIEIDHFKSPKSEHIQGRKVSTWLLKWHISFCPDNNSLVLFGHLLCAECQQTISKKHNFKSVLIDELYFNSFYTLSLELWPLCLSWVIHDISNKSWSSLATWWEELTHLKRPWCWERLRAGGEGDDRRWDGITDSMDMGLGGLCEWWWTRRPGLLWFMELQRVGQDWATELKFLLFLDCLDGVFPWVRPYYFQNILPLVFIYFLHFICSHFLQYFAYLFLKLPHLKSCYKLLPKKSFPKQFRLSGSM